MANDTGAHAACSSPFDAVVGAAGLAALSPLLLAAAALITLEDGGPILFVQVRLGKGRVPFHVVKLRTMRAGRVTRVGAWLRKTGLDEVPQFWNVLRGEMNIVGPRPLTSDDIRRLRWDRPQHDLRFVTKPGVTGPVQVLGAVSAEDSARLEQEYILRRSLHLDLAIVAATSSMLMLGKSRVQRWLRDALEGSLPAVEGTRPPSVRRSRSGAPARQGGSWIV